MITHYFFFQSPRSSPSVSTRATQRQHICSNPQGWRNNKEMALPAASKLRNRTCSCSNYVANCLVLCMGCDSHTIIISSLWRSFSMLLVLIIPLPAALIGFGVYCSIVKPLYCGHPGPSLERCPHWRTPLHWSLIGTLNLTKGFQ